MNRRTSVILIAIFLSLQVMIPAQYYIMGRGDDERFRWRMFSSTSLQRCQVRVEETVLAGGAAATRNVDLAATLQARWIGLLEQNNPRVVRRFLLARCEQEGVRSVRLERSCVSAGGVSTDQSETPLDCPLPSGSPG